MDIKKKEYQSRKIPLPTDDKVLDVPNYTDYLISLYNAERETNNNNSLIDDNKSTEKFSNNPFKALKGFKF